MEFLLDKRKIEVSNLDRIYFPDDNYTKKDIIDYYQKISPNMLPFLKNRPLVMLRYPSGIQEEGFYHKQVPDYFPKWVERVNVEKKGDGDEDLVVCNDVSTLVYLASQGCITNHIWLSKINKLNYPDKMVFDLDPSKKNFEDVKETAVLIKNKLEEFDLKSFVKTTGSKGLHVVVPLDSTQTFDYVRAFARKLAEELVQKYPKKLTVEHRLNKRRGRLFIDYLRNAYAQTIVAPYSIRAYAGAPVATPIEWDELSKIKSSKQYNIKNIFRRLSQKKGIWKNFDLKQRINL